MHKLRHSFAIQIAKIEKNIQVVSELLEHRCVSSNQVRIHINGQELIEAIQKKSSRMNGKTNRKFVNRSSLNF